MIPSDEMAGATPEGNDDHLSHAPKELELIELHAEMHMVLDRDNGLSASWDPNEVFATALLGIFEAIFPPVLQSDTYVLTNGSLQFRRDMECRPPPIDRHGAYVMTRKVKESASNAIANVLKHSLFGNSRSPSRVSSRAQSRVSSALKTSVLAMTVANLAFGKHLVLQRNSPFHATDWHENDQDGQFESSSDPHATMSSRQSLTPLRETAQTTRVTVDYQEVRRRDEIERDISTREGRENLAARIHRKGRLKLKLRSKVDPSISADREEQEAVTKGRTYVKSRGKSTGSELLRMEALVGTSVVDAAEKELQGLTTTRSHETTYRSEDYEGLMSELLLVDKQGGILIGENCVVVSKKPRRELIHNISHRSTANPRIHFPGESTDGTTVPLSIEAHEQRLDQQSLAHPIEMPTQSLMFEGHQGTFQLYPKIELKSRKTPLAKGVTIKPIETSKSCDLGVGSDNQHIHAKHSLKLRSDYAGKSTVLEDRTNDTLEQHLIAVTRSKEESIQERGKVQQRAGRDVAHTGTSEKLVVNRSDSIHLRDDLLPHKTNAAKTQFHSLRLRTPVYGNTSRPHFDFFGEDETIDYADSLVSLKTANKPPTPKTTTLNLPKFSSYVREYPSPPSGNINVVSASMAAALVSSPPKGNAFPSSPLPSVIRRNR